MAEIILYVIPLVFSVWILSAVFGTISKTEGPRYAKAITAAVFIAFLLVWWYCTITVVGPIF